MAILEAEYIPPILQREGDRNPHRLEHPLSDRGLLVYGSIPWNTYQQARPHSRHTTDQIQHLNQNVH